MLIFLVFLSMEESNYFKGRGAQVNPNNKFFVSQYVQEHIEGLDEPFLEHVPTQLIPTHPKKSFPFQIVLIFILRNLLTLIRDVSMAVFIAMPAMRMSTGDSVPDWILNARYWSSMMLPGYWKNNLIM